MPSPAEHPAFAWPPGLGFEDPAGVPLFSRWSVQIRPQLQGGAPGLFSQPLRHVLRTGPPLDSGP